MQNWIQILIILLAIGGPVLGRALQAIDKKQKARQRQKDQEAREFEALRTGRNTTEVQTRAPRATRQARTGNAARPISTDAAAPTATARNATQRMQELARKRQQQLEELRRRQRAAQHQAEGQTAQSGQSLPPKPDRPVNRPQAGQSARPTAKPARRPRPQVQAAQSRPLSQTKPPTNTLGPSSIHELAIDQHILHPATEAPGAAAAPVKLLGKQMSAEDWRRFIVARELLEPPLALRKGHGGSPL